MFVFHAEMEVYSGGPCETHNLGIFAQWSDACLAVRASMVVCELAMAHHCRPDVTVDATGMVKHAVWNEGEEAQWHITRHEVK